MRADVPHALELGLVAVEVAIAHQRIVAPGPPPPPPVCRTPPRDPFGGMFNWDDN